MPLGSRLGQIRAAALNEQVRAASFAKALLLIRQKAAAGAENIGDGFSHGHDTQPATNVDRRGAIAPHRQIQPSEVSNVHRHVRRFFACDILWQIQVSASGRWNLFGRGEFAAD